MQKLSGLRYEKFLDKKKFLDHQILESVKSGELSLGVVWINSENKNLFDKYSKRASLPRGRNTS